jgi:hypothetical protein
MPAPATMARPADTAVSTAAASVAVRPLLEGPPSRAAPLGATAGVAWLQVDEYVLALSGPGTARAPNGVITASPDLLVQVMSGCTVGNGQLETADLEVGISRWWDPRPVLGTVSSRTLAGTARRLMALVGGDHESLTSVKTPEEAVASALGGLGKGPGLTPEGDDLVVGLLAGLRLLGTAAAAGQALALLDAAAPAVATAPASTTALSATLIRHGWRGEVAAPLGALFQALTGSGSLEEAVSELGRLGATSGMAMGRGALAAAHLVAGMVPDDR